MPCILCLIAKIILPNEVSFSAYLLRSSQPLPTPPRCNITDLLSGLETLVGILVDNDLALEALPMLSLWEYVAYKVARCGQCVDCHSYPL